MLGLQDEVGARAVWEPETGVTLMFTLTTQWSEGAMSHAKAKSLMTFEKWGHLPGPQPPGLWLGWPNVMILWLDLAHLTPSNSSGTKLTAGFQGSRFPDWGCRMHNTQSRPAPTSRTSRIVCYPSVYPLVYGMCSWWFNNHLDTITPTNSKEHTHCPS